MNYRTSECVSSCVLVFKMPASHHLSCRKTAVHENFREKIRAVCVMYSESEAALTVLVSENIIIHCLLILGTLRVFTDFRNRVLVVCPVWLSIL